MADERPGGLVRPHPHRAAAAAGRARRPLRVLMPARVTRAGTLAAIAAGVVVCGAAAAGAGQRAGDGRTALQQAIATMGVDKLRTLRLTGHGSDFLFGQAYDGSSPWPRFHLSSYQVEVDYEANAWRDQRVRNQAENPPRGGGNQPIAEQRQVWSYRDNVAWNGEG